MAYNDVVKIIHDKAPSYISFVIMLKFHFTANSFFHILSFFFRFIGILILCANFSLKLSEVQNKSLSYYLRYLTTTKLLELFKITNKSYVIISFIIFFLFCCRIVSYIIFIKKLNRKNHMTKYDLIYFRFLNIFQHLVYLLYPFLLEFLVQIIFSFIFPDTFLFQKNQPKILNIIVVILNLILIIGYNINNYFFMKIINKPYDDRNFGIKYRYSYSKFWIVFSMQNIALIQNIQLYFSTDKQVKIFSYIYLCVFCVIFLALFLISLQKYNYQNIINSFISVMASFSFFSILIKCVCSLCGYAFATTYSIISVNILKIIVSIYFSYLNDSISNNFLFKMAMNELFKVNKEIAKRKVYDCFVYIIEILKELKYNQKNNAKVKLLNHIFQHQNNCSLSNCKCKLIQIIPHGREYDKNYSENLIDRISFLIESTFIKMDFSENCELCLILSEHFFFFRDNPVMAYSFIQTLLIYNLNNLTISQLLNCYEVVQKYIEAMINIKYRLQMLRRKPKSSEDQFVHDNLLESNFKENFLVYEKIRKIQEIMNNYCQVIVDIIKKRNIVEESVKFKKIEDTGEILSINFTYLTEDKIEEIIKTLKYETNLYRDLNKEMTDLKTSKFPMEFYYKIFLFWDTFMESKIDEKFIPVFFSFTKDHNLYSTNINPNVFIVLRQRYIELNKSDQNLFYCIFKYSKGMTISYFSESLAQILGYLQSELIDSDIDTLMPNEISDPHNNMLLHYLITQQNRVYKGVNNKLFNKKGLLYNAVMNGSALLGLGRNILVMTNMKIMENENEFFLYYNQSLDLISFSNNLGNSLSLDLDLVTKCNLNLLVLFGINQDLIKKKLNEIKVDIVNYKSFLEAMTEEIYSKKLYKPANKYNSVKYKLFDEIESQNFEENENMFVNNKLLKAQRCLERIYNHKFKDKIYSMKLIFKRPKSLILNNFDKFVNNNEKIDLNDKNYKSLLESFYLLQNQYSQNKMDGKSIYNILVDIHILYDVPFITIKIKEELDFSANKKNLEIEKPLIKTNLNLITKSSSKNVSFDLQNKQYSISQRTISSVGIGENSRITNFEKIIKLNKNFLEKYIKVIVIVSIFFVLVVYIAILVYQLNVIQNIYNIFVAFYYNYIQRDKIVNLRCSISSGYFFFAGLTNYSRYFDLDRYRAFIRDKAEEFSESYHIFYQNYIIYRFALGKDLSPLYKDYNFTKVHISWDEYETQNNYVEEAEVMIYQCISSVLTDKIDDINYDQKLFFNSNYTRYPRKIKSLYGQILYYFSKNMQTTYIAFFDNIQEEINNAQEDYSRKNKSLSTIIEVLGFLLNLITFISCIYFLKKSNINLYKLLINLFIDFTQEGNYSFKNSYDNFLMAEKLTRLKFLLNNFSVKAIDKFNKRISPGTIANMNDLEENDNNLSIKSKPSSYLKKQNESLSKKKKHKITKNTTTNANENKINTTNNNSLTVTKSQNKLLNTLSVNLISKLNQNVTPDKSNVNISTKNMLNPDSSSHNINSTNNKKNEVYEENTLTKEMIYEKLEIVEINIVKFFTYSCILLIIILFIYMIVKLIQTYQNFTNAKNLFIDYSIVTFEYSMIINYFNNFNLLLMNQPIGREDFMKGMQARVEAQFMKSQEVKKKSINDYPRISKIFEALNNEEDTDKIRETLCRNSSICITIFNSDYNVVKKGIDVGVKSIAQEIYNMFDDYLLVKDELGTFDKIKQRFINADYNQIDLSLNFLLSMVEDRCAEVFLVEAEDLITNFKTIIISLNIFVIVFLAIIYISMIFLIINRITILLHLIEKSSMRISISINLLKEKNVGTRTKSDSLL